MQIHLRERDLIVAPQTIRTSAYNAGHIDCRGGVYAVNAFIKIGSINTTGNFYWQGSDVDATAGWTTVSEVVPLTADDDNKMHSIRVPVTHNFMRVIVTAGVGGRVIVNSMMVQLEVIDTSVESDKVLYFGWQNQ